MSNSLTLDKSGGTWLGMIRAPLMSLIEFFQGHYCPKGVSGINVSYHYRVAKVGVWTKSFGVYFGE